MGLDLVELAMEIEDAFAITIPDDDASRLSTVGQTAAYVVDVLRRDGRLRATGVCPSARAFYRFRAAAGARLGVPRSAVRPDAPVGALFPRGWRAGRAAWADVSAYAGLVRSRRPPRGTTVRQAIAGRVRPSDERAVAYGAAEVWELLRTVVAEQAGVAPDTVRRESRYIQDLHLN